MISYLILFPFPDDICRIDPVYNIQYVTFPRHVEIAKTSYIYRDIH
jgi:hypothetical protein